MNAFKQLLRCRPSSPKSSLVTALLLSGTMLMNAGCARTTNTAYLPKSEPVISHIVSQLRFETKPDVLTAFFWLNNDEVMFAAHPVASSEVDPSQHVGIYVWNVRKNSYRKYADLSARWAFSYDDGNILYTQESIRIRPQPSAYMLGKMGQERRYELAEPEYRASRLVGAALGPRMDPMYQSGDGTTSLAYHLRPEHGVLLVHTLNGNDAIVQGGDQPVRLVRPSGESPVVLAILGRELGTESQVWYSEFRGRYVILPAWHRSSIGSGASHFSTSEARPVYLLAPDGRINTEEIPPGPWDAALAFPTRAGIFWISKQALKNWNEAGGWILVNGRPQKLFDLPAEGVSVSPDGCTISYAVGNYGSHAPWVAQALRVCSE